MDCPECGSEATKLTDGYFCKFCGKEWSKWQLAEIYDSKSIELQP